MIVLPNGLGNQTVQLTELQIQVLIEVEPILRAAKLHLACPRCIASGRSEDALVQGRNHGSDTVWSVSCPCTDRTFHRKPN